MTASTRPESVAGGFSHRRAGHCASGSLRDAAAHHALDFGRGPLSEGMCFGLGSGLGFLYADVPGVEPPIYLVGRTEALEEDFADNLGIALDVRETDDARIAQRWLVDELALGRPPIVWTDIAELEYLRVKMSNTRHAVVVTELDAEAGTVLLADNDRDGLQPCSLASLARARASTGFPGPNRNRTYVFDWPERLPEAGPVVRRAVSGAVANMRTGGTRLGGMDAPAGLDGLDHFAAAYRAWPEQFGDRLPKVLGALSIFIVKAGTGGALFRSLYAEFLDDAAALLGDRALADVAADAHALAGHWRALAATARAADHTTGLPTLDAILVAESALVERLQHWLET